MLDAYNREINYLRISVTDRCNLRCTYCMPAEGIDLMGHDKILTLEQIAEVAKIGAEKFGIRKIRLTGGEPLVRRGIVDLVKMIADIEQVEEIGMTTNGILLPKFATGLKEAGLKRVNISLDTLSAQKYNEITRGGNIQDVLNGIRAAQEAGLSPVKINTVKLDSAYNSEIDELKAFCEKEGLKIQFIRQMNLETGTFSQVEGGQGGNCNLCNRLRLTADGHLKPCLFSNNSYNTRELGIEEAFIAALSNKPEKGETSNLHGFYNIGG